MARIKINDLPKDMKISKSDMRKITGGASLDCRVDVNNQNKLSKIGVYLQAQEMKSRYLDEFLAGAPVLSAYDDLESYNDAMSAYNSEMD